MLYCYFNASCFLVLIFSIESIHFLNKLSPRKIHFLFLLCQIILILVQEPKSIRRIFSRTVQVIYHIIHFQKFHIVQSCMQLVRFPNQVHRQSIICRKIQKSLYSVFSSVGRASLFRCLLMHTEHPRTSGASGRSRSLGFSFLNRPF